MRIRLRRWAAACVPLTLFAATACAGAEGSEAASRVDEAEVSATNDASRESAGRGSGEIPSRGDSGPRGEAEVGESAGPGGRGPEEGPVAPEWPENDVTGLIPQAGPRAGGEGPVLLTYDAGAADGFAGAVRAAARSWNDSVPEVDLRPAAAGTEADIRIVVSKGWPGAAPEGPRLGKGTVTIGRRALAQGHDAIRVVSHEFGHMLGLEDSQPGPCSSLMSGKSAGPACTNSVPDTAEIREVRRNFSATATVG
ncbi:snapalysin family zinc-dependent metalloprotease [Streptomyces sp. WMMB 322]|uniref:snapalysin family zinc-dependent metalloprotease n=1 Tax=Streptomyces sp. WMMB 322 TaxID=1286821 RepID=UPI000823B5DD|nr:snapalysin family zinc-dependent metalloprotease [Streptomyces sp. WMMB 322]SCK19050.1 Streptomyces extracellular neutral proteinase (M7) family protein [Streptomyces sp. WMMB 322]